MNILILNWRDIKNPKSGGAEIVTMEHAKAWVKSGHSVTWFTSQYKKGKKSERIDGVEITRMGGSVSVYFFTPFYYLFNRNKFDLVVDEIHGLPFFTPLYVRKPTIAFIHEVADQIWDYMYPFPVSFIGKKIEPFYFKLYKKLIFWVPCESTIADLEKHGIARRNCRQIVCAIKNKSLNKVYLEKEKDLTLIFVSRIVKMKGVEDVVLSYEIIRQTLSNAKLWLIGDGEKKYVDSLKKLLKSKGIDDKAFFFGKVSENKKLNLMKKAHILLHASVKEGWGLVTVEAASQSTPAVVYNVAGLRDSVLDDKTGVVLRRNTPDEMAKQTLKLIDDKKRYRNYQENGLKWAKSLTWERATKQSLDLINEVTKNK